jgi:hypothetical protein
LNPITQATLEAFFQRLGQKFSGQTDFYLLGGSALCLLGSTRQTLDIDFTTEPGSEPSQTFEAVVKQVAREMNLDVEPVPIAEFVPLPQNALSRRRIIGRFGHLDVFVYDLYTIALSKISRGFESDIEDVLFLLRKDFINLPELKGYFEEILPAAPKADIDRREFRQYFEELVRRYEENQSGKGNK